MKATGRSRHLYVIGCEAGPFKVGLATDLRSRLSAIQVGSHHKLSVLYSTTMPWAEAADAERHVHRTLHSHRLAGEWFSVSLEQAQAAVASAAASVQAQAELRRLAEQQAADAAIVRVDVDLVHTVTDKEYRAEQAKIEKERKPPRIRKPVAAPPPPNLAGLAQLLGALGTLPEGSEMHGICARLRRDAERTTRAVLRQARGLAPVRGRANLLPP